MMEFDAFLQKQEEIYQKFDDGRRKAGQEGLLPDKFVAEEQGAFFYALRPGGKIRKALVPFLNAVCERGDHVVVYTEDVLHTTISDYQVGKDFNPSSEERNEVRDLFRALRDEAGPIEGLACGYRDLVMNQTTVILKGYPDERFIAYADRIVKAAERRGVSLRFPWGAHITLARATKSTSPVKVDVLAALCKEFSRLLPTVKIPYDGVIMGTLAAKAGHVHIDEF